MANWLRDRKEMAYEIEDLKDSLKAVISLIDLMPFNAFTPADTHEREILTNARKAIDISGCPCRGWKI